jgi:O-antigen ligase
LTHRKAPLEGALFAALLAVLVWAPLPFGSNRIWAAMVLSTLLAGLTAGWLLLWLSGRTRLEAGVWRRGRWPLALLLLVQFWVWLQTVPVARPWVECLSPLAASWQFAEGPLPLSLDPEQGRLHLLRGLGLSAGFFLTLALVNSPSRVRLLLQTLVLSGTAQAVYGAAMVISGWELGFLVDKYAGRGAATGTFVNSNHLAGYLILCLAAGIGLLWSQLAGKGVSSGRERLRGWLRLLLSARLRLRVCLAVMVIALVMTGSRMGNLAFFAAVGLAGAAVLAAGGRFSIRAALFLGSLLIVDMLILGRWFGLDRLLARVQQTTPLADGRADYLAPTLDYLQSFALTGSGAGSFYGLFPNFQPPDVPGLVEHAHNDYLEFAVELGVPALLVLAAIVLVGVWQAWRVVRDRHLPIYRGASFAVLMACCWLAIHSVADFNMQIPANALTFCVILALAWVCRGLPPRKPAEFSGFRGG